MLDTADNDENNGRMSALDKALAVLEAVSDQQQAVGLPDLAARLNLPRQTVHRLLGQLEEAGLVRRDPSRERYAIGPRQSRLALASLCSRNQSAPLRVLLQDLVDDLKETCNIGVLDDLAYVYTERIECKWPLRTHLEAGSRVGAHAVSGGKIMLAALDPCALKPLLKGRKLMAYTRKTRTRFADLEADLAEVRARGYALNNEELFDGIIGVAVPIQDAGGRTLSALAVHGPLTRLSLTDCERFVPKLRKSADRIAKVWFET
jgi:IclR family transcriptional regulator, acetate operon repressor